MASDTSFNVNTGEWLGAITSIPFNIASYTDSLSNRRYQREQDRLNRQMQYDFAQNSIKWKVNDAKEAGLHPLAALGVSSASASPVYSSSEAVSMKNPFAGAQLGVIDAQIRNIEADTELKEAQAGVVSQGFDMQDSSSPGPSTSQKTTQKVNSSFVTNNTEKKKLLQESAQDSKFLTGAYDAMAQLESGKVPSTHQIDALLTITSGFAHTAPKGETKFMNGMRNIKDSVSNLGRDISSKARGFQVIDKLYRDGRVEDANKLKKIFKSIDDQHKSYNPWR